MKNDSIRAAVRTALVAGLLALAAMPARAETYSFDFGTLLSPTPGYQPAATFANLSVSTTNHLTYSFALTVAGNLASAFGNGAFIGEAIFNTWTGRDPVATALAGGDNGVSNVRFVRNAPQVGSVGFDFGDCFGGSSSCNHGGATGRLTAGERVSWTAIFATPQPNPFFHAPPVALHVQGFNVGGVTSGWYIPTTPIPEPEAYVMLLAGLSLMGFVASRRRRAALG